jgi:hypothetical protein
MLSSSSVCTSVVVPPKDRLKCKAFSLSVVLTMLDYHAKSATDKAFAALPRCK